MCELWRVGADASSKPVSNCLPCVDVTREGIRQRFSTSDTSTSGSRLGEMLCCYFPLKNLTLADVVCDPQKHLQMCFALGLEIEARSKGKRAFR